MDCLKKFPKENKHYFTYITNLHQRRFELLNKILQTYLMCTNALESNPN